MDSGSQTVNPPMPEPFRTEEFEARRERARSGLAARDLAAAVVMTPENLYYLSGYDSPGYYQPQALFLPVEGDPFLFCYVSDVDLARECPGLGAAVAYGPNDSPMETLGAALRSRGVEGPIGVETRSPFLSPAMFDKLGAELAGTELRGTDGAVEECRAVKSAAEIAHSRFAARIASETMADLAAAISSGPSEGELAAVAYGGMLRRGSEYPGSPPYISSGPRVTHPHASWTSRSVQPGEQVHLELAACVRRYGGALMRDFIWAGELDGELARLETAIVAALEAAIAALRPGTTSGEVDAACRAPLDAEGFAFQHEAGYAIGVGYPPGWNESHVFNLKPGDERQIEAGMVFHLVPHVVLPGLGGVGLSETVLVTAEGCEVLTSFPRRVVTV